MYSRDGYEILIHAMLAKPAMQTANAIAIGSLWFGMIMANHAEFVKIAFSGSMPFHDALEFVWKKLVASWTQL